MTRVEISNEIKNPRDWDFLWDGIKPIEKATSGYVKMYGII